jgi:hypothetical protein
MKRSPTSELLRDWSEIADDGWETLLLGNGMSINISSKLGYESLYDEADFKGGLSDEDRSIFEAFDTPNFEVVLSKLRDAITLAEVMGEEAGPYQEHFTGIQNALGETVERVHPKFPAFPEETLTAIQEYFEDHSAVFTTSYDLIAYWAIGKRRGYDRFCDCFWGEEHDFDPDNTEDRQGRTPIYYLHGALHLVVGGSGVTRKLTRAERDGDERLRSRFGDPIPGDPKARTLLVTEGSARDKMQAIEGNAYLAHVYETFKEDSSPIVVFGQALGEQDEHLLEAIAGQPDRRVAISMREKDRATLWEEQHRIRGKLPAASLEFFDASTHPLGSADHRLAKRATTRKRRARPE